MRTSKTGMLFTVQLRNTAPADDGWPCSSVPFRPGSYLFAACLGVTPPGPGNNECGELAHTQYTNVSTIEPMPCGYELWYEFHCPTHPGHPETVP